MAGDFPAILHIEFEDVVGFVVQNVIVLLIEAAGASQQHVSIGIARRDGGSLGEGQLSVALSVRRLVVDDVVIEGAELGGVGSPNLGEVVGVVVEVLHGEQVAVGELKPAGIPEPGYFVTPGTDGRNLLHAILKYALIWIAESVAINFLLVGNSVLIY